jgi:hypothetical protein
MAEMRRFAHSFALLAALLCAAQLARADVDWSAHASDDTVVVVTRDADGAVRDRTIWLLVLDGHPYIRTGSGTTWGENALRDRAVSLRLGDEDVALRAERVTDAASLERIATAFHAKYGFADTLSGFIRGEPIVFRLEPR